MKKLFIPISILTIVLIISGILIYQTGSVKDAEIFKVSEFIHVGTIIIFFILGIYFGVRRIKSKEQGFPEEDELSKRVAQKAAAISFYISLFLWLVVLFIARIQTIDTSILFGYGFIGMALVFVLSWSVLNFSGIKDE